MSLVYFLIGIVHEFGVFGDRFFHDGVDNAIGNPLNVDVMLELVMSLNEVAGDSVAGRIVEG
jgi:hypothetical protein